MKVSVLGLAALLAGCATGAVESQASGSATTDIRKADGQSVARAQVVEEGGVLRVTIEASGLPAGTYGAHVHTTGRCDAPDFTTAGGHWNPMTRQHGSENPQGPHMGDLPNLAVGANGSGSISFTVSGGRLRGGDHALLDADGAAVVVHAGPDDYRTDPSGNSGARIACGVLN